MDVSADGNPPVPPTTPTQNDDAGSVSRLLDGVGSLEVLHALGQLTDDALFVVDSGRRVVFWSAGAERLLGYPASEVVGEYCLKANRCVSCMKGCGIQERGQVKNIPLRMYRKDDSEVAVRKTARAFFDDSGRFLGGVELLRPDPTFGSDLSSAASAGERKRIVQALEEAGGQVTQAAKVLGISRATLWRKRKRYGI